MDARAEALLRRHETLAGSRGVWESHWMEIADRVLPRMAQFHTYLTPGTKRTERMIDATAALALERYAAAVESLIAPRNERWHALEAEDPALAESEEVKDWLEKLTALLFRMRYNTRANFSSQAHECFIQLGAFGTTALFIDDAVNHAGVSGTPVIYRSQPLFSIYVDENSSGMIDVVHRETMMKARQVVQRFGLNTPAKIREAAEKGNDRDWCIVHCVHPADDPSYQFGNERRGYQRTPIASYYVSKDEPGILEQGGYRRMPYAVSRNVTTSREIYGRSPAMIVLPDIKMLNEVQKEKLRALQKMVNPPLLLADDGTGGAFSLIPGALNYGHVDASGHPLAVPLTINGRVDLAENEVSDLRASINSAFLVTLFQILAEDRTQMTAYEAALRAQEKGQLLAPTMGRQEAEFLGPCIERELDVAFERGIIARSMPPMPEALARAGGALRVKYTSPLARLQLAEQAVAIMRWLEQLGTAAAADPEILDNVDMDACARILADADGVPEAARRKLDDVTALRASKRQQQQIAQTVALAEPAANAAKNIAQASAISGQQPPPPALPVAA